jgi:hypothetical protein
MRNKEMFKEDDAMNHAWDDREPTLEEKGVRA